MRRRKKKGEEKSKKGIQISCLSVNTYHGIYMRLWILRPSVEM